MFERVRTNFRRLVFLWAWLLHRRRSAMVTSARSEGTAARATCDHQRGRKKPPQGVGRSAIAALFAVLLAVGPALGASAGPADVEGYVLSIEGQDVFLDVGSMKGASVGETVELWRPIELVNPVTKQRIKDRYRIGTLKLVQVRDRMAVAVVDSTKREPAPGDSIVLRRKAADSAPAAPAAGTKPSREGGAAPAAAGLDAEAKKVAELFDGLREAPLIDRIRAYIAYVKKNPQSPFARVLREDAVHFHRLLREEEDAARESKPEPAGSVAALPSTPASPSIDFDPPAQAIAGRDLELAFHLSARKGAVLHVRRRGEIGFRPIAMAPAGGGYFRATIPAATMRPPTVEYFVEAVDAEGRAEPVAGTVEQPFAVAVETRPDATPPTLQERTTASILTDLADFNRLSNERMDRTWQTEGTLGMRFRDIGIRALRTGAGVYRGVSGSLDELDDPTISDPRLRYVGLTYGYLEGEFGIVHTASLTFRAVAGLTDDGMASGGLVAVRVGNDLETNLLFGGEILGGVGVRSIAQLEIGPLSRFPVLLRSEVTNQPAGVSNPDYQGPIEFQGSLGLRGIAQAGYQLLPGFVLSLRLSYQGRTIFHAGPGLGGAVSYTW